VLDLEEVVDAALEELHLEQLHGVQGGLDAGEGLGGRPHALRGAQPSLLRNLGQFIFFPHRPPTWSQVSLSTNNRTRSLNIQKNLKDTPYVPK
jgi:hypothetical protein